MSKNFYVIKLDITEIHYYVTLIKCRKKIAIMSRVRISKTSSKMSSYLKVWSFCVHSFAIKWWPFQFLAKFLKIAIYLVDVFWLRKHQVYVLINVRNIHKRQRSSGKFGYTNLCFMITSTLKWYLLIFGIFIVPVLKWLLTKMWWKKLPFPNFFQISALSQNITFW